MCGANAQALGAASDTGTARRRWPARENGVRRVVRTDPESARFRNEFFDTSRRSALGTGVTSGSTCGGGNNAQPSCSYSNAEDRLFTWTAHSTGSCVFTTASSTYDSVLSLTDSTSGVALGCNDDANGTLQSMVVVNLTAGQQVRVFVDGYSSHCGSFSLNLYKVDANIGSSLDTSISQGNTCGASHDSTLSCAGFNGAADLTLLWAASSDGTFTFSTTGSSYDTMIEMFNLSKNNALACNDDANGTTQSAVTVSLPVGQRVLVTVDGFGKLRNKYSLSGKQSPGCCDTADTINAFCGSRRGMLSRTESP